MPLLRGWATLAVVLNHANGWAFVSIFWWGHRYMSVSGSTVDRFDTLPYWLLTSVNQLTLFSVPTFLFISGLFMAYAARSDAQGLSWSVVRSRMGALLGPYLVWSALIFAADAALGTVYTPWAYGRKLITGGATDAYFFIPLLAQLYILSPWLARWARRAPRNLLGVTALVQIVIVGLPYLASVWGEAVDMQRFLRSLDWVFVRWAFFYALGLVIGAHQKAARVWLMRHRGKLIVATVLLGAFSIWECRLIYGATTEWDWAYTPLKLSSILYATAFILAFLPWGMGVSRLSHTIEQIGAMSYGIYLVHPKAMELAARLMYHVAPDILARAVWLAMLLFVAALVGAWLLMRVIGRSPARRVYHLLFG
jgi:peptidoglycan/LPS O-acetylase OafA/YrhL